jgi:hypothetical protein
MINLVQKFLDFLKLPREQSQFETLAQNLKAGGLYSIIHDGDDGTFGVVKILVLEPPAVHLCIYANTFSSRPESIDLSTLSLGGISIEDLENDTQELNMTGCGIGHLPLSLKDFGYGWQPVFLGYSLVTEDDLEGYKMWKEGSGGVFGSL